MFRTDWFRFYIEVDDGRIVRLNPDERARAAGARAREPQRTGAACGSWRRM